MPSSPRSSPRHPRSIGAALAILLAAGASRPLAAQSSSDDRVAAPDDRPVAAWISVALGPGNVSGARSGAVAGAFRANLTMGPVLVTYRSGDVGPFFSAGDGVRDDGVLVGLRTSGRRAFASAALGYDSAKSYHDCENCNHDHAGPTSGALAYDVSLHANAVIAGLAVSFAGAIGPARVRYSTVTLGLELGWFGM